MPANATVQSIESAAPTGVDPSTRVSRPALRVLFITMTDDIGSDRIVAAMGRLGCECAVVGSRSTFAGRSRFSGKVFALPRLGGRWLRGLLLRGRVLAAVREWHPDLVIPLDECASSLLRDPRFGRDPEAARLIERSLGDPTFYATVRSHADLIAIAGAAGVRTPRVAVAATLADARRAAAAFGYPLVLIRTRTNGRRSEALVSDEAELAADVARATRFDTLVVQAYRPGRMASHFVACASGAILDGISFLTETHDPETGAATVVRAVVHEEMDAAARTVVGALRCSGFVSLDFILAPEGVSLVGLHPRPVVGGHLGRLFGHDIHEALLDHLATRPIERDASLRPGPERVALFPQELDRDPASAALDRPFSTLHDLPWDDLDSLEAYAHWLERRHARERAILRRRLPLGEPVTPLDLRALVASIDRYPH